MGKLAQIKELVQKSEELVDEVYKDLVEEVDEYNEMVQKLQMTQESIQLATLPNLQEAFEGMENLPEVPMEPQIEEDQESIKKLDIPRKYEIQEPRTGLFGAKLFGFLTFLIVGIGAFVVGAMMKKIDLMSMNGQNWRQSLEDVLGFYSSLITQSSDAGPALGSVVIAVAAIGGGYLVYFLLANSAASKNLTKAQEMYQSVKEWCEEQRSLIEKLRSLRMRLKDALYVLEGNRIFGEEFAARVKRVRFFDGDDYMNLSERPKEEVDSARLLLANLSSLAHQKFYIQDFALASSIQSILDEARTLMESIKEKIYG